MVDFILISALILFILLVLVAIWFGVKYAAIGAFLVVKYTAIGLWKAIVWLFDIGSDAVASRRRVHQRNPRADYHVADRPVEAHHNRALPVNAEQRQAPDPLNPGGTPRRIIFPASEQRPKDKDGKIIMDWTGLHNEPTRKNN